MTLSPTLTRATELAKMALRIKRRPDASTMLDLRVALKTDDG
ncbi:MAG: hypothetical protein QGD90_00390 [Candidatus Hydrogenedentes bacterium]|nr:hypothetical protein [Candidatus Hydrogenedentota bacterium]